MWCRRPKREGHAPPTKSRVVELNPSRVPAQVSDLLVVRVAPERHLGDLTRLAKCSCFEFRLISLVCCFSRVCWDSETGVSWRRVSSGLRRPTLGSGRRSRVKSDYITRFAPSISIVESCLSLVIAPAAPGTLARVT